MGDYFISHKYSNRFKMVDFEIGNLFKMPQILKIPELGMAFITMMVARMAYGKNIGDNFTPISFDDVDSTITLWMVVYGFLLIAVVQLLGTFGGSNPLQDTLMAFCGFGLYLGVGAKTAAYTHQNEFELGVL